ncbi:pseudouridine synthase [Croceiramulus getboli]|nr:pseudouridine synthase [Flavobacteriaceae bacterium YJPT1-3]
MSRERQGSGKGRTSGRQQSGTSKPSGRGGQHKSDRSPARGNAPIRKKPGKNTSTSSSTKTSDTIRLNKYIANSGMCSRREADMYIATGNITVNGQVINEMGYQVKREDDVRFDGRRIQPEPQAYVLLNKPKGFAVTTSNEKGMTVMDLVSGATKARIKPIGRLGRNASGLLLFTNDDTIHQKFTNSKKGVEKLYHLELNKNLKPEHFQKIQEGLTIEGKKVTVEEISYVHDAPQTQVGLKIKNTGSGVIRSIFDHLGYQLIKVDRVMIGSLTKKDLARGRWRHLTQLEVNSLRML